jgi:DNA topoisomerase-1
MQILRKMINGKFKYPGAKSKDIERIKKLRIPPMWVNVNIDPSEVSKIQATGYDSKNRKQYIYNSKFIEKSKEKKFKKMNSFDYSKYNSVIKKYMSKNDLSKDCVIANVIKLMEDLNIRVGNESYKKENGSFGITTLLKKHLTGTTLSFVGKKGVFHVKHITNPRSITFIKRVKTIRGPNLFYYSPNCGISSSDLNTFMREKVDQNVTCKDIRTYSANKIFVSFMKKLPNAKTEKERKTNLLKGLDYTAQKLGNTRKICKDSYISPKNISIFS